MSIYRPRYRKMNKHLEDQIAKQEERIKTCGKNAWINLVCPPELLLSSIYSNRMKSGLFIPLGNVGTEKETPKITYSAMPNLKMRKVWREGYAVNGNRSDATYVGECLAESHIEACERIVKGIDRNPNGTIRLRHDGNPSVWGCALFDNEVDARKSFG